MILVGSGVLIFFTATWQYYVLRVGKLAVVEPVISLELPLTVLISALLGREVLSLPIYVLIITVFVGIILTVSPTKFHIGHLLARFEKGTFIALVGAAGMALTNFVFGHNSQVASPLVSLWVIHFVITVIAAAWLIFKRQFMHLGRDFRKAPVAIIAETVFDNTAWVAYAYAVLYIPISIAITVSEGYIILAVLLGVVVNRERLKHHQYLGVVLAIAGVLLLSYLSG
jgi:drug/metabolite transporter (DMT)-like permease